MQFLHRNRFAFLTVAVLIFASIMTVQQYFANLSTHTRLVEDFLALHERGEIRPCEHLYEMLVQQLPRIDDHALVDDLQRTAMIVDLKTKQLDNLVWKYHVSVNNELQQRSNKRLAAMLEHVDKQ
jgi:hypothetical protein